MKKEKIFICEKCKTEIVFEYNSAHAHNIGKCNGCGEEFAIDDSENIFFASIQKHISEYDIKIQCAYCNHEFGVIELLNSACPNCGEKYLWCYDEPKSTMPVLGIEFNRGSWHLPKYTH